MLKVISRLPLTIIELHGDLISSRLQLLMLVLIITLAAASGTVVPSLANTTLFSGKVGGIAAWMIGLVLEYVLGVIAVSSVTICTSLIAAKLFPGLYKKIDQRRGYFHLCVAYSLLVIVVACMISHHTVNRSFLCFKCWIDCLSPKAIPGALFWGLFTVCVKSFVRVLFKLRKAKETNGVVIKKGNGPEDHDDSATPPFGLAL